MRPEPIFDDRPCFGPQCERKGLDLFEAGIATSAHHPQTLGARTELREQPSQCELRIPGMSTVVTTSSEAGSSSSAVSTPRSGPSPAVGSRSSRSNLSQPGGCSFPGAVMTPCRARPFQLIENVLEIGWPPMRESFRPAHSRSFSSCQNRQRRGMEGDGWRCHAREYKAAEGVTRLAAPRMSQYGSRARLHRLQVWFLIACSVYARAIPHIVRSGAMAWMELRSFEQLRCISPRCNNLGPAAKVGGVLLHQFLHHAPDAIVNPLGDRLPG